MTLQSNALMLKQVLFLVILMSRLLSMQTIYYSYHQLIYTSLYWTLLDLCSNYGNLWRIKFIPLIFNIIEFGKQRFPDNQFFLNSMTLQKTDKIKYLVVIIEKTLTLTRLQLKNFKMFTNTYSRSHFQVLNPPKIWFYQKI